MSNDLNEILERAFPIQKCEDEEDIKRGKLQKGVHAMMELHGNEASVTTGPGPSHNGPDTESFEELLLAGFALTASSVARKITL